MCDRCGRETPTKHHRRPQAQGGGDETENISLVSEKQHRSWHTLFDGNMTPEDIASKINEVWLDPHYRFVVRRR